MTGINHYIGIDPGLQGAIVVSDASGMLHFYSMPVVEVEGTTKTKKMVNAHTVASILAPYANRTDVMAVIEKVSAMPGQGVTSMFSFGTSYGILLGVLAALKIPYVPVTPVRWKKAMLQDMGKDKDASVARALQMFPQAHPHLVSPRGKKRDGMAEALLMSQYGKTL